MELNNLHNPRTTFDNDGVQRRPNGPGLPPGNLNHLNTHDQTATNERHVQYQAQEAPLDANLQASFSYWRFWASKQYPKYKYRRTRSVISKDSVGREYEGVYQDVYPSCKDARFTPLVIQCTDNVFNAGNGGSTWERRSIKNVGHIHLRVANWVFNHLEDPDTPISDWGHEDQNSFWKKFPLTVLLLLPLGLVPRFTRPRHHNGGKYDSFPYVHGTSAKTYRNRIEEGSGPFRVIDDAYGNGNANNNGGTAQAPRGVNNVPLTKLTDEPLILDETETQEVQEDGIARRVLAPRYLCAVTKGSPGYKLVEVKTLMQGNKGDQEVGTSRSENAKQTARECPKYVFVAYTKKHFNDEADIALLHRLAQRAAKDNRYNYYWIAQQCVVEDEMGDRGGTYIADDYVGRYSPDVWTISDVIRGAVEVVIALPEGARELESLPDSVSIPLGSGTTPISEQTNDAGNRTSVADGSVIVNRSYLQDFSSRVWTYPELLLSQGRQITVYISGGRHGDDCYSKVQKVLIPTNFFEEKDALVSRQLFDHYLGSQLLSGLELTVLALHCLSSRKEKSQYLAGDYSYALMGLLRRRPKADPTDTPFLAFARLSLANHNDQLLERLICTLPADPNQPWHCMDDAYGALLWDIVPYIQVAGIGVWHPHPQVRNDMAHDDLDAEDIVIIDGCYAATIHWDQFKPVAHAKGMSWSRRIARILFRLNGIYFIVAIACLANSKEDKQALAAGLIFLFIFFALFCFSPFIVRALYDGKIWGAQPWFFGFEGYLDIGLIEQIIFGANMKRLKWSHGGSILSRYDVDDASGNIMTLDPITDQTTREKVTRSETSSPGDHRIFTLVDTGSMTVTLFEAKRPPVVLLVCGSEGGMQRAIGCSFDHTNETLYRETVLRVPTQLISKMDRISRVKFGIKRPDEAVVREVSSAVPRMRRRTSRNRTDIEHAAF